MNEKKGSFFRVKIKDQFPSFTEWGLSVEEISKFYAEKKITLLYIIPLV